MGMTTKEFLEHHGIQHPNGVTEENRTPAATWVDVSNSCISGISRINNDPIYAGANLNKNSQLQKMYDDAVMKAFNDRLTGLGVVPMNKIDAGAFLYSFDRKTQRFVRIPVQIAHQNGMSDCPDFSVNLDDNGFVVGIKAIVPKGATGAMWQSGMAEDIDSFLEHHGIKGMHWGVQKAKVQKTVKRRTKRYQANKKIKSKRQDIAARRRQLSEHDLKKFIDRIETEKKLKNLVADDIKPGRTVTKKILSESGQKVARTVVAGGGLILVKALVDKKMGKSDTRNENLNLLNENIKATLKKKKGG